MIPKGTEYSRSHPCRNTSCAQGTIPLSAPARGLICSDGLMRLVDVIRRYSVEELFEEAAARGLAALVDELRDIERSDPTCLTYPRAKQFDDTTAICLRSNRAHQPAECGKARARRLARAVEPYVMRLKLISFS